MCAKNSQLTIHKYVKVHLNNHFLNNISLIAAKFWIHIYTYIYYNFT